MRNRLIVSFLFIAVIAGRLVSHASVEWGFPPISSHELTKMVVVDSVVVCALFAITWLRMAAIARPRWLAVTPIVLVVLSSPILLSFPEFWANAGWQFGHVVWIILVANVALVIALIAITLSPRYNRSLDSTAQRAN